MCAAQRPRCPPYPPPPRPPATTAFCASQRVAASARGSFRLPTGESHQRINSPQTAPCALYEVKKLRRRSLAPFDSSLSRRRCQGPDANVPPKENYLLYARETLATGALTVSSG